MSFSSMERVSVTDENKPCNCGKEEINTEIVVIDMSWLRHYDDPDSKLFRHFPLRTIIEAVASIPLHYTWESLIWESFYERFDTSRLDPDFVKTVKATIEKLTVEYYKWIEKCLPGTSSRYLFGRWSGRYSLILLREDYWRLRNLGLWELPE